MRSRLLLLVIPLILGGCVWEDFNHGERYSEDFHYSVPLQPGGKVSIDNFNGSIEISGWDQANVDVNGSKYAATVAARDAIKIEVTPGSGSVSIRTVRPSEHRNAGARYVLKVPRRVQLDRIVSSNGSIHVADVDGAARLKTSNGGLRVMNLDGSLNGSTSNGPVELDRVQGDCTIKTNNGRVRAQAVHGALDASTTNGSVDAALDELRAGGVRISTSNGGITLRLAGNVNGRLSARTSNGSIHTDYEVRAQGEMSKHRLDGTIGSGGPLLDLSTSNGGIRLVRQ